MEQEKTRKNRGSGGFTLVELIVVIAILAILAGVGTVAYSGYVKYTQKGVDRQTVGELIYAATLADYANPALFPEGFSGMIVITSDASTGTIAAGTSDADAFKAGLEDSMGDLSGVRLNYTDWSGSVSSEVLSYALNECQAIQGTGNALSYAGNAKYLWSQVENLAKNLSTGAENASGLKKTPEELMAAAADQTTTATKVGEKSGAEAMGTAWSATDKSLFGTLTNGTSGGDINATLSTSYAHAATIARNYAFAEYLKANNADVSDAVISELQTAIKETGMDLNDNVFLLSNSPTASGGDYVVFVQCWSMLHNYAIKYLTETNGSGHTQAYTDGVGYYTLMKCVDEKTKDNTYKTTDGDYMDSIASCVNSVASALAMDTESFSALQSSLTGVSGSTVVISAKKENGKLSFIVSPADADPRDGSENESGGTADATAPAITFSTQSLTIGTGGRSGVTCTLSNFSGNVTLQIVSGNTNVVTAQQAETPDANGNPQINILGGSTPGTATITVTATDGTNTAVGEFTVTVMSVSTPTITIKGAVKNDAEKYASCDSLSVSGSAIIIVNETGAGVTIKCYCEEDPTTVVRKTNLATAWSAESNNKDVVTAGGVSGGIQITGISQGTTTVTVTILGKTVDIDVTVI